MNSTLLLSAALATALLSACGNDKATTATTETTAASAPADSTKRANGPARASSPGTSTAATGSLTGAMAKMMQQMNALKPIGNTDHDFSHLMIAHHQGAIDMSEIELRDGKDATLKAMAEKIIADQKKEQSDFDKAADRLDGSAKNYAPKDPADKFQADLDAGMKIQMSPLTPTGNVDMDYAMMMLPHHQAAMAMSKAEVANGKDAEVKKMAQLGIDQQTKEIQQFNNWLAKNGRKM